MHFCRKCDTAKPCAEFYVDKSRWCGHHSTCRECAKAARKADYHARPDVHKARQHADNIKHRDKRAAYRRLKVYGLTPERHAELLATQLGLCAICRVDEPLHVDHDHATGAVRGLLCDRCNRGIGFFDEKPETLVAAAAYVQGDA